MISVFKQKNIWAGVFMVIFYQVIMLGMFMPGYSAIPKNISELTVAIVNEDAQAQDTIIPQLEQSLPFHIITDQNLLKAQDELNNRNIHLIIHIPSQFSQALTNSDEQAQLNFYVNGSNPATVTSTMDSVIEKISTQLSNQMAEGQFSTLLQSMHVSEDQAQQTASALMNKITVNKEITNAIPTGTHNQMAPMFLTLSFYVGAMIYSMLSIGTLKDLSKTLGKWRAFMSLQAFNVLLSVIAPLIGIGIYFAIQGYSIETFIQLWMAHALGLFTAIQVTSIFVLILGKAGMLINIPLLLAQTIASGTVISQETMPLFFKWLSNISVMFYSSHLDLNILFGGGQTKHYILGLLVVLIGAFIINMIIHSLKSAKKNHIENNTASQPAVM